MKSKRLFVLPSSPANDSTFSIRNKIKNYEGEYYYGKDFFPRCLYAEEAGDPKYVQRGYLRSALLVKVRVTSLPAHDSPVF